MTKALAPIDSDRVRAREERDARVDHIVELMARGEWEGTRTTLALAGEWEVSRGAVSDYAREASGIIRRLIEGDPEDIKAEILAGIERVRLIALELTKTERVGKDEYASVRTPNVAAALQAYELKAKLLGLFPKGELDLNVRKGDEQDLSGLTDEELDVFMGLLRKGKGE